MALLTRGRANVLPGAIMFSIFGLVGQLGVNAFSERPIPRDEPVAKPGFWKRMSEKRFSPVKVLSNEEYANMLEEKMLRVDAEIAILEDRIFALRREEETQKQDSLPKEEPR